jgi:hypothetical protein
MTVCKSRWADEIGNPAYSASAIKRPRQRGATEDQEPRGTKGNRKKRED